MPSLIDHLSGSRRVDGNRPWPRAVVGEQDWRAAAERVAAGHWTLLDLWGDAATVHMAVMAETEQSIAILSIECPEGRYPSVGRVVPAAIRLERAAHDLHGLSAEGAPDKRPWLDHGRWGIRWPLGPAAPVSTAPAPYQFLAAEGESLHHIPVGPVHAGIIEPGHFRFTANGETVVRLEARLGYVHKGIEALMSGATLERAARLAGHVSGDSTIAYQLAFARAVEAALGLDAPPRAVWLRALMAELERLANHFGDIGAICNDAAFTLLHAHCGVLRERVLRAADACFGHRLMMDRIVPGGVAVDPDEEGLGAARSLIADIRRRYPQIVEVYDNTASLQDRTVGTGILAPELARAFGCGGFVGRASGRAFDARRAPSYPPYGELSFDVPVFEAGDVDARVWVRIREVEQSLSMIEQILARLPRGPVRSPLEAEGGLGAREAGAVVEGFRGDVLAWVRLAADGTVVRCRLRDPSWFQWPLLEAVIEGNIVADFPLCNKSFNCSYSGHDI
jgi:Ni,Fe-hydrogenase III large subunit